MESCEGSLLIKKTKKGALEYRAQFVDAKGKSISFTGKMADKSLIVAEYAGGSLTRNILK